MIKMHYGKSKIKKRVVSVVLSLSMAVSVFAGYQSAQEVDAAEGIVLHNPIIVEDSGMESGQKVTWDCVWFGSYPQTEVKETDSEYVSLTSAAGWDSNGDAVVNGTKYRRMRKDDATYATSGRSEYYDWEDDTTYHYFRYEPVKWRVLKTDGSKAMLLSDIALDDREYNTEYESVTWETSTIRSWLNGYDAGANQEGISYGSSNFIDSAFTSQEKQAIVDANVINNDNINNGTEGGNNTADKLFLLSESEVYTDSAVAHGFVSDRDTEDEARRCKSSDYAKAMGVDSSTLTGYKGNCWWWLRSPGGYSYDAASANSVGCVEYDGIGGTDYYDVGVRVALNLNLSSSNLYTYAGTVCSDGTAYEQNEDSDKEKEQKFIQSHLNYIGNNENNTYHYLLNYCDLSAIALRDYSELKDTYDKWRVVRGSIFDNPYEVALAELIISEESVNGQMDGFTINLYSKQRSIINNVMKLIDGKVSLTSDQKSRMEKLFSERKFDDDTTYQLCANILSNYVSEDELKTLFQAYDTSNTFMELLGDGKKIVDSVVDVINYSSILQAYNDTSDEFKKVLLLVDYYCQGENSELDYAITQYLSVADKSDINRQIVKRVEGNMIDVGKDLFEETILSKVRNFMVENMDLSNVAEATATKLLAVIEGMKIGYSLGVTIDNILFNTDKVADAYITTYANCKLAYYMKFALDDCAVKLKKNQTIENAELFCESYNMYKHTQINVAENMIRYFVANEQSLIDKIFKNSDYEAAIYQWQILKLNWDNAKCHDESTAYKNTKNITIACPVDIEVKDSSNNLILKVESNAVTYNCGKAVATVRNNIKYITVPDDSYTVNIMATDIGKMSYSITNYNYLAPAETVNYENIQLEKGKSYSGEIIEGEDLSVQENALVSGGKTVESTTSVFSKNEKIDVSEIKLSKKNMELTVGSTEKLETEILPATASVKTVTWFSANPDIATVDEYGTITALAKGNTTVYCSTLNGSVTNECRITVKTLEEPPTQEPPTEQDTYCMVGTLSGTWNITPDSYMVQSKENKNIYAYTIKNVNPGEYEYQILKNNSWSQKYSGPDAGFTDSNYSNLKCTVKEKCDVTVTRNLKTMTVDTSVIEEPETKPEVIDISAATIKLSDDVKVYNGSNQQPDVLSVTLGRLVLKQGVDYIVEDMAAKDASKYTVLASGIGNCRGQACATFTITPKSLKDIDVKLSVPSSAVYKGKSIYASVTAADGSYPLRKDIDYKLSYKNNNKIGKATVTMKGNGNYKSTISKTFRIVPGKPVIKKVSGLKGNKLKVYFNKIKGAQSYNLYYRLKGASRWKSVKSKKNTIVISGLKKNKTYQIRIRAYAKSGGSTYTGAYSRTVSAKVKK